MNASVAASFPPYALQAAATPAYEFRAAGRVLRAGAATALPRGTRADLEARLPAMLAACGAEGIIAGALPFLGTDQDCLWSALPSSDAAQAPDAIASGWSLTPRPDAADYAGAVARALRLFAGQAGQADGLRKVVLARTIEAVAQGTINLAAVLDRLSGDPAVTGFAVRLPDVGQMPRHLIGATPELLIRKQGGRIASHPLAGSARRLADAVQDAVNAAALDGSEKDRREHGYVTEFILDTLSPLCRDLGCPEGTRLTHTRSMWHLGTRIEGTLRDPEMPVPLLASLLHPTPAVCGVPQARAAQVIAQLEPVARGFYAGAVGWCDAKGDGDWFVAIRCAEVAGNRARLYAGAGIVAGSEPEAEVAETGAKFTALLAALGLDA